MSFFDGHFQHFVDVFALVTNIQSFAVITFAVADIARHVDVGQEMHFYFYNAITLASLAAPPFDVKTKASWFIPSRSCLGHLSKQFANWGKQSRVRSRIRPRGAPNRALINVYHFIQVM